jgi:hypothetical protein
MAGVLVPRTFERLNHEAPVLHSYIDTVHYHAGRMYNYSPDGMCFVSNSPIDPGSEIMVKMEFYSPIICGSEACENYRAKVVWCREVKDVYASYYGKYEVGVNYLRPPL